MGFGSQRARRRRRGRGGSGHAHGQQPQGAPHATGHNGTAHRPNPGAPHARRSIAEGPTIPGLEPVGDLRPIVNKPFEDLTSIDPQPRLTLEYPGCPASCRLIDLFCPIGRGTRGLIVSPPKAGKPTLLKDIGTAILRNHPDVELIVLLVDERPEEVTDFRRHFERAAADLAPPAEAVAAAQTLLDPEATTIRRKYPHLGLVASHTFPMVDHCKFDERDRQLFNHYVLENAH
ncbi:hypothetical protein J4558_26410 [Leptolyngbya sp. 15MV]|nr:hypothetical protein J4558_26410 [Leptolyngbya sp. 15MV]